MLADAQIRRAQPTEKLTKMSDGGGFYLQLNPNGSSLRRMKYRYVGSEKLLSFGQ